MTTVTIETIKTITLSIPRDDGSTEHLKLDWEVAEEIYKVLAREFECDPPVWGRDLGILQVKQDPPKYTVQDRVTGSSPLNYGPSSHSWRDG